MGRQRDRGLRDATLSQFQIDQIRESPLEYIDYFVEWGASGWTKMTRAMIEEEIGPEWIKGKTVMDLGARRGKMATLFALLGANVIGIDHNDECLEQAQQEIRRFGVEDKVEFVISDAVEYFASSQRTFDCVFLKSVLTCCPTPLEDMLDAIVGGLEPNGRFVAIENGKGNFFIHWLRRFRSVNRHYYHNWHYFEEHRVERVRRRFHDFRVRKIMIPPVYTMVGERPKAKV